MEISAIRFRSPAPDFVMTNDATREMTGMIDELFSFRHVAARPAASPDRRAVSEALPSRTGRVLPRWTVVLAFYNEAAEIAATLDCLARQSRSFRLVLIDNGSTDASVAICHAALAGTGIHYWILSEACTPGQTAAFAKGLSAVDTEFVATCDADTFYPAGYLETAEAVFDADPYRTVAVSAYFTPRNGSRRRKLGMAIHQLAAACLLPRQTHVGAAGQTFRTSVLRAAGSYDPERWPFLLGDHEVMHRVMKHGRQQLAAGHSCSPSERRGSPLRWSFVERLGYHLVPFALKDRYFRWLGRRFARRGMIASRLRDRDWEASA